MKKVKFENRVDLTNINDAMELDSNLVIACLSGELNDGTKFEVSLMTQGKVSVDYKDITYHRASKMPEELLKLFHEHGFSPNHEDVCVDNNNWFELFIIENGKTVETTVVDAENISETEMLGYLADAYNEYRINAYQEPGVAINVKTEKINLQPHKVK